MILYILHEKIMCVNKVVYIKTIILEVRNQNQNAGRLNENASFKNLAIENI